MTPMLGTDSVALEAVPASVQSRDAAIFSFFALALGGKLRKTLAEDHRLLLSSLMTFLVSLSSDAFATLSVSGPLSHLISVLLDIATTRKHEHAARIDALNSLRVIVEGIRSPKMLLKIAPALCSKSVHILSAHLVNPRALTMATLDLLATLFEFIGMEPAADIGAHQKLALVIKIIGKHLDSSEAAEIRHALMKFAERVVVTCGIAADRIGESAIENAMIITALQSAEFDRSNDYARLSEYARGIALSLLERSHEALADTLSNDPQKLLHWRVVLGLSKFIGHGKVACDSVLRTVLIYLELNFKRPVIMEYTQPQSNGAKDVLSAGSNDYSALWTARTSFAYLHFADAKIGELLSVLVDRLVEIGGFHRVLTFFMGHAEDDAQKLATRLAATSGLVQTLVQHQQGQAALGDSNRSVCFVLDAILRISEYVLWSDDIDVDSRCALQCSLLSSIEALVKILTVSAANEAIPVLLPSLLGHLGSHNTLVRECAASALSALSARSSCESPKQMLLMNIDYLVDNLGRQLRFPRLYAEAPRVLSAVLVVGGHGCAELIGDLLRVVADQLAIYQRLDQYCVELLEVFANAIALLSADAAVLAVKDQGRDEDGDGDEDEASPKDSMEHVKMSRPQEQVVMMAKVAIHFVAHDHPAVRLAALKVLSCTPSAFSASISNLWPLAHQMWQPILMRISNEHSPRVVVVASKVVHGLSSACAEFIGARVQKQFIPRVCARLREEFANSWRKIRLVRSSESLKLQESLLEELGSISELLDLDNTVMQNLMEIAFLYLHDDLPRALQLSSIALFNILKTKDSEVVSQFLAKFLLREPPSLISRALVPSPMHPNDLIHFQSNLSAVIS